MFTRDIGLSTEMVGHSIVTHSKYYSTQKTWEDLNDDNIFYVWEKNVCPNLTLTEKNKKELVELVCLRRFICIV